MLLFRYNSQSLVDEYPLIHFSSFLDSASKKFNKGAIQNVRLLNIANFYPLPLSPLFVFVRSSHPNPIVGTITALCAPSIA